MTLGHELSSGTQPAHRRTVTKIHKSTAYRRRFVVFRESGERRANEVSKVIAVGLARRTDAIISSVHSIPAAVIRATAAGGCSAVTDPSVDGRPATGTEHGASRLDRVTGLSTGEAGTIAGGMPTQDLIQTVPDPSTTATTRAMDGVIGSHRSRQQRSVTVSDLFRPRTVTGTPLILNLHASTLEAVRG